MGEIPLSAYDSCRLMAVNLYSYVEYPFTEKAKFNWELFTEHVFKFQQLMDDLVDLEVEKIEAIIAKIKSDPEPETTKRVELELWENILKTALEGRRTGLGVTAEGDMLAALGLKYGTSEATEFAIWVHETLAVQAYSSSISMARYRGKFWDYDSDIDGRYSASGFIQRVYEYLSPDTQTMWDSYGRRNIACLTIAPTGSVSILTRTTSGIEPLFMPYYTRRRKTEDPSKSVHTDKSGDMWEEFFVFHPKFVDWYNITNQGHVGIDCAPIDTLTKEELQIVYQKSPYFEATSNDVDYLEKVRMQGEIQRWVDHSISVTVNMPKDVTEDMVAQVYMQAWKQRCKGITIYRDGSRDGVLISTPTPTECGGIVYGNSPKRPKTLPVDIYTLKALGKDWTAIVGLLEGKPYEIFLLPQLNNEEFPKTIEKGTLTKVAKRKYRLVGERSGKEYSIDNIISRMSDEEQYQTRDFSRGLRHGEHPKYIISDIDKDAVVSSFRRAVSRILKNYLASEDVGDACPSCGEPLTFESGCKVCKSCGWSACG